jgi:hypothetical protein
MSALNLVRRGLLVEERLGDVAGDVARVGGLGVALRG